MERERKGKEEKGDKREREGDLYPRKNRSLAAPLY